MDINQLTDELFSRAPTLARVLKAPSRETCRAVILAAVDSSAALELLLGHGVDDAVLGVVACLREAREHGLRRCQSETPAAHRSSSSVTESCDVEQPSRLSAECADLFELDIDAAMHADTMRAPSAMHEVAS